MFGPRPITVPASIFAVGGLIALSFAKEYYSIFLAQSLCFGIGAAGIFMPGLVIAWQILQATKSSRTWCCC
jgi:MCP family monocarboxylic acid transporter-like MFS transporter 10